MSYQDQFSSFLSDIGWSNDPTSEAAKAPGPNQLYAKTRGVLAAAYGSVDGGERQKWENVARQIDELIGLVQAAQDPVGSVPTTIDGSRVIKGPFTLTGASGRTFQAVQLDLPNSSARATILNVNFAPIVLNAFAEAAKAGHTLHLSSSFRSESGTNHGVGRAVDFEYGTAAQRAAIDWVYANQDKLKLYNKLWGNGTYSRARNHQNEYNHFSWNGY